MSIKNCFYIAQRNFANTINWCNFFIDKNKLLEKIIIKLKKQRKYEFYTAQRIEFATVVWRFAKDDYRLFDSEKYSLLYTWS